MQGPVDPMLMTDFAVKPILHNMNEGSSKGGTNTQRGAQHQNLDYPSPSDDQEFSVACELLDSEIF